MKTVKQRWPLLFYLLDASQAKMSVNPFVEIHFKQMCKQIYKNCHYSKYSAFFDETASAENVTEISDQELKT